jgi:hypothetical protein
VHRSTWSNLERGLVGRMAVATVRRCLGVLEAQLVLLPRWRGAQLDRLLDEDHAALAAAWKARLERWGWLVRAEVSYSRYGERGRIDLLGWHASARVLLVVEIKTSIVDVQDLVGGMDVKTRLATSVARGLGWPVPAMVVPALIMAEGSSNRRHVARLDPLFAHLGTRGKAAIGWLRRPGAPPGGLLILTVLSVANQGRGKRVGASRVRVRSAPPSTTTDGGAAASVSDHG